MGVASYCFTVIPKGLTEMAPVAEVGHVGLRLAPWAWVGYIFAVIETVGNDLANPARSEARGDVLAIPASARRTVLHVRNL